MDDARGARPHRSGGERDAEEARGVAEVTLRFGIEEVARDDCAPGISWLSVSRYDVARTQDLCGRSAIGDEGACELGATHLVLGQAGEEALDEDLGGRGRDGRGAEGGVEPAKVRVVLELCGPASVTLTAHRRARARGRGPSCVGYSQ
jgi:hypothetical protein